MFLRHMLTAARTRGLHACAQAAFTPFHSSVLDPLQAPPNGMPACGMALDVPRNPDNLVLQIPQDRLVSELRPSFKLVSSTLQIVARPRLTIAAERTALDVAPSSPDETTKRRPFKGTSDVVWSEAFAQWTMSEHATLAFGRQSRLAKLVLVQHLEIPVLDRVDGSEVVTVGLAQCLDFRVTALLPDFAILIPHAIVQTLGEMLCCHINPPSWPPE